MDSLSEIRRETGRRGHPPIPSVEPAAALPRAFPRILAIDYAKHTGWAVGSAEMMRVDAYGLWNLESRVADLHANIQGACVKWNVVAIAYEDATFGSHQAHVQSMHNELRGIVKLVAAERGLPSRGYNPMTIKKFATGNGRAKKPQMIRACRSLLGIDTDSDDVADACFIYALAQAEWANTGRLETPVSKKTKHRRQQKKERRLF